MFVFRIREIRNEKNLSLEDLSDKSAVNLGYLSQLERGEKQNPTMNTLFKVATALGVNIKDLFYTIADIDVLRQQMYISISKNGMNDEETVYISRLIDLLLSNKSSNF